MLAKQWGEIKGEDSENIYTASKESDGITDPAEFHIIPQTLVQVST